MTDYMRLLDPLLVPKLSLRALDDLHEMAELAATVTDEERVDIPRALDDLHSLAEATERLTEAERRLAAAEHVVAERSAQLSAQLAEMRALGGRLEPAIPGFQRSVELLEDIVARIEHLVPVPSVVRQAGARLTGAR